MIDLNKEYSRDHFLQILRVFDTSFSYSTQKYDFTSKVFLSASRLGIFEVLETEIIEVEVSSDVKNRLTITKEAFKLKRSSAYANAIVAFINPDSSIWRLSLLTTEYSIDEQGVKISNSNPKRFSYLLGPGTKVLTPTRNVLQKGIVKDLVDLKSRFSVEVVNKEFYMGIANSYSELIGGKRRIHNKNIDYKGLLQIKNIEISNEEKQELAVRLIGRVLFMWFLKQKKSESNIPLIPESLLSASSVRENKNFYSKILQPLFFEALNTRPTDRQQTYKKEPYYSIPYLNGGLFNPHPNDYYNNQNNQSITIPDEWILSFFEMLEQYNFTIDENSSFDLELSIDPEMLGRIFENLLAEINPDTGETARKSTGSFYTPREIVDYMISESLYAYLAQKTDISEEKLRKLTSTEFGFISDYTIHIDEIHQVFGSLNELKVLDPACGSGAFPIGMLQRIIQITTAIDPTGIIWFENYINVFQEQNLEQISQRYSNLGYVYPRKLQVIKNNIYGVDIQPIAVEITKLRSFLSLIVDEIVIDENKNRGIEPLPNLEFKFVCANSLIPLEEEEQLSIFDDSDYENDLEILRNDFFISYDVQEKAEIKNRFEDAYNLKLNLEANTKRINQLRTWNPFFSSNPADFFDSQVMFNIRYFNIVIGNPPYNVYQGNRKKEIEEIKKLDYFRIARGGKLNAYRLFLSRAPEFLDIDGIVCQIFQNSFLGDVSAKNLREYYLENFKVHKIDSFPERDNISKRVFPGVKMSTCIMLAVKGSNIDNKFILNEYSDRGFSLKRKITYKQSEIFALEPINFTILSISESEKENIKYLSSLTKVRDYGKCYEGEINLTFHKKFLTTHESDKTLKMVKGASVQQFFISYQMSQGIEEYVNIREYKLGNKGKKSNHYLNQRLVMQGITGVDEKKRLKSSILEPMVFCANSTNYVTFDNELDLYSILGQINSSILNWFFKKFSTNSNVNCYEFDNLPLIIVDNVTGNILSRITKFVVKTRSYEQKLDSIQTDKLLLLIDVCVIDLYYPNHVEHYRTTITHKLLKIMTNKDETNDELFIKTIFDNWFEINKIISEYKNDVFFLNYFVE